MRAFNFFLDLLSNKKCYSCKKEGHFLCEDCYNIQIEYKSNCYVCKGSSDNFLIHEECKDNVYYDKVIILKHYNSKIIKKLIKNAKFYGVTNIFDELNDKIYTKFLINHKIIDKGNFLITGVPSNFFRKLKRGYNSSEIMSKNFSKISGIKYKNKLVYKVKNTRQQSKLSRKQRLINLKNAFKINKRQVDIIDGKTLIILDDVISTGTTLNEISKILKQNGAKKIIGLIIASD